MKVSRSSDLLHEPIPHQAVEFLKDDLASGVCWTIEMWHVLPRRELNLRDLLIQWLLSPVLQRWLGYTYRLPRFTELGIIQ